MNEKEVAELRRRFQQDRSGISHVRGCYVNENREIVSQFDQPLGVMTQEENEKILGLLKRTLSGTLGKNLLDITFATQQVVHGEEHKLLMALRSSELGDEDAVQAFFQKVISTVTLEGNYMILLVHDAYDVPYRSQDGDKQDDASSEVFSYILCSVCPVKLTKPALSYYVQQNEFHNRTADWRCGGSGVRRRVPHARRRAAGGLSHRAGGVPGGGVLPPGGPGGPRPAVRPDGGPQGEP